VARLSPRPSSAIAGGRLLASARTPRPQATRAYSCQPPCAWPCLFMARNTRNWRSRAQTSPPARPNAVQCRTAPPAVGATAVVGGEPSIHPSPLQLHSQPCSIHLPQAPDRCPGTIVPVPPRRAARQVPVEHVEQGPLHDACCAEISPPRREGGDPVPKAPRPTPEPAPQRGRAVGGGDDRSVQPATPVRKRSGRTRRVENHAAGA
jgi:hypothetical protein